jgi:hypothetical protein
MLLRKHTANRDREEQKEIAKKGGIASGEIRRKKKTMKEQASLLLSLANKNPKIEKIMNDLGIEQSEQTNQMAMIISILNKVIESGDVSAFNSLQATIGEKPVEKIEQSGELNNTITVKLAGDIEEWGK